MFGDFRAAMSFARLVTKLVAIQTHERGFRARKKRGKQQQHNKQSHETCYWNVIAQKKGTSRSINTV